jgi:catechol 2,3-dioxygenase-like lactoylglutathione lyase family enzyme
MTDLGETPRWRGINHLALITPDMDATVRFYHGVLGMRLVATLKAGPMRHYFFELGPQNTVAFFEWTGADTFAKPAGMPSTRTLQLDHLSFNLADEEALLALRERLEAAGSEVTPVVEHGIVRSIYFHDPNGIALEASWWEIDVTGRPADFGDRRVFADPDPVPALRELAETGELAWLPETHLAGAEILDPA